MSFADFFRNLIEAYGGATNPTSVDFPIGVDDEDMPVELVVPLGSLRGTQDLAHVCIALERLGSIRKPKGDGGTGGSSCRVS